MIGLLSCNPSKEDKKPVQIQDKPKVFNTLEVYEKVDSYYEDSQLKKIRKDTHISDKCLNTTNFYDSISIAVDSHTKPYKNLINSLYYAYSIPRDIQNHVETSLLSHPLCEDFDKTNIKDILKKIPSQEVIDKMNNFSKISNSLRNKPKEFKYFWKKTFSCLAYTESLTTADTKSSYSLAKKFNYTKPQGVKFYDDPYQSEDSRYNIGLYQFTPNSKGNIHPCIENWNLLFECKIDPKSSQKELIKILGSGQQVFNAFCGVNKIVGTFAIQQNTKSNKSIFKTEEGKPVGKRCVTPFIYSGWGYNHFGPFQNSTGENLDKLLTCILK